MDDAVGPGSMIMIIIEIQKDTLVLHWYCLKLSPFHFRYCAKRNKKRQTGVMLPTIDTAGMEEVGDGSDI